MHTDRPDPEKLLSAIKKAEASQRKGKLKIFFGMSAGVGKTYTMLQAARENLAANVDVVIGIIDTHGRKETAALVEGIPVVPEKLLTYKGATFRELDIDAILARKPKIVLVDELAHTNIPGSRHPKRWQDVVEILDAGIDVFTTLNVQHIESRKDIVEGITGIAIHETIPDSVLEVASEIELVDVPPSELLKRLQEGKVYLGEQSRVAIQNFFKEDRLTALREIALRITAEKVDHELQEMITTEEYSGWKPTEKLLVAVDHTPESRIFIRVTRRLAFTLSATWVALHVDTGEELEEAEQAMLAKNLELARGLGAEVMSTSDPDVCKAIGRFAKLKHITQIVIGQPKTGIFRDWLSGGSFLDRLATDVGNIDIHIIKQNVKTVYRKQWWRKFKIPAKLSYYWTTTAFLFFLTLFNLFIEPYAGYQTIALVYVLGILGLSLFSGKGPILFAAVISSVIWSTVFLRATNSTSFDVFEDVALLALFFIIAVTTGILTHRIRERESIMRRREDNAEALYVISDEIVKAADRPTMVEGVTKRLGELLNADCIIVYKEAGDDLVFDEPKGFLKDEKEQAVAEWVFRNGKIAGLSTDTLPSSKAFYIPLQGFKEIVGVLGFSPKTYPTVTIEERSLLYQVSQQVAVYLERSLLKEKARKAAFLQQVENIHQAILDSVSTEFRNPMSAIIGVAKAMESDEVFENKSVRYQFLNQLHMSVESLNRIVDNFLDMSRLSSGFLTLDENLHHIEEVLELAIDTLQHHLFKHQISINIPKGLPPLMFDFPLMEIVFTNLLLNAAEYSPPDSLIEIRAEVEGDRMCISISDQGPGIPAEDVPKIFDKFYRGQKTHRFGAGLGLSIAKAIIEIHEGTIIATNRPNGGTTFTITLPIKAKVG